MKIRFSALGALCAALVVTAGLVASAGTASATTVPAYGHGGNDIQCTTATSCTQNGAPYTGTTPTTACTTFPCRLDPTGTLDNDPSHGGLGGLGGHFHPGFPGYPGNIGGGVLGIPGLNLLNGNTIVLANGQSVDVCAVPQWQTFYNRYNPYFVGSWRAQLNELRYQQLVAQAGCGNSNLNGLTLVNGNLINLGQYGVTGGNTVNVCDFPNYDQFNGFGMHRFGGNFNPFVQHYGGYLGGDGWRELRARANCGSQIVVVPGSNTTTVEQAPATVTQAAPAPAATPEAAAPAPAPAPLQSSGNYHYPASAPDTGN